MLSISVSGTSCRAGPQGHQGLSRLPARQVGALRSRVLGYSCSESRYNKSQTQYSSRVTCSKGGKTVKHTYTQFT